MQKIWIIVTGIIIVIGAWFVIGKQNTPANQHTDTRETVNNDNTSAAKVRTVVTDGVYAVQIERSTVGWAGKKPLIDGYINKGSFGLSDGTINVAGDEATGMFTLKMNTLSVFETPTKPGKESTLEEHLKSDRWFDVEKFPEASFTILEVTPRTDSATTFLYNVRGNLTLKDQTHELVFPATIYLDSEAKLHADAEFEFDRTKWGITSGSGLFFDNLADNVIDDMVALSFNLVAEKQ